MPRERDGAGAEGNDSARGRRGLLLGRAFSWQRGRIRCHRFGSGWDERRFSGPIGSRQGGGRIAVRRAGFGGCRLGNGVVRPLDRLRLSGLWLGTGTGKERQGIEVAVRIRRDPNAQMDVSRSFGALAGPDGPESLALGDDRAFRDLERAQVLKRCGVAVLRLDGDRSATGRDRAGEAHDTSGRRGDDGSRGRADVDATVLARGVGVASDGEVLQHRPIDGPGPGERGRSADQVADDDREQDGEACHRFLPVVNYENDGSLAEGSDVVKRGYSARPRRAAGSRRLSCYREAR